MSCPRGGHLFGNVVGISLNPLLIHRGPILSIPGTFFQRCFLTVVTPSQKILNVSAGSPTSLSSIFPGIAALQPNRICSTPICQDWTRPQSWWRYLLKVSQGLEQERQFSSWAWSTAPIPVQLGRDFSTNKNYIKSLFSIPNPHPRVINICFPPFPAAGRGER